MLRHRAFRVLALLAGIGVVLYALVSLYLPSSRRLIFGVNKTNGSVRVVRSHVTFLPPFEFYRLTFDKREGSAQRDGVIRIVSKDGVPVTVGYRLRFGIAGDHIPDARRLVNDGWSAWIRARVGEAVSAVTSQIPIEELLSPASQFHTLRDPLRQTVTKHLAASGLNVTGFSIARLEVDREALLRVKRAELRRDARSAPNRVAVFALDGADWELLKELADDGRLPNLKALTQGGTTGSVTTIQPTVSPMLWTTVATGLTPDRHGVIDFTDRTSHAPIDSSSRRAPALWDIADAFARPTEVVNWWTAWPPTSKTGVFFDTPGPELPTAIYPPTLGPRAQALSIPVNTVGYENVRRFVNISQAEFNTAVNSGGPGDPVNIFREVLAKTWSDHRVAINLYNEQKPLLLMMSYDGTDAVNHLFAPYHPPYREGINQNNFRKFWPTVANYYSEVDRLIGEWMNVLPPDTTVIITSAHGFRWGKNRPREMPTGGAALSDHRNPGIFIAYGQHVPASHARPISIYDLAPTILTLLGLPKATDMPGQPAAVFKDITPITSVRLVSYSEFVVQQPVNATPQETKLYQQYLQAIGHLNDPTRNLAPVLEDADQPEAAQPLPPDKWGRYAYYNNLGVQLRTQKKTNDAIDAFNTAIEINPSRAVPYLNLAMALFDKQMYSDADAAFQQAVAHGLPNAETYFVDYAALYREHSSPSRSIIVLYKGQEMFPQSALIAANLGAALVSANRYSEGVPQLERALGLQPSSTLVLNNLGVFYARHHDYGRALDYWNRSLSIDPHQPQIRDAANAARAQL